MKNKFTKLMAALALLTFLIPLTGWGQIEVTFTPGTDTGATSVTKDGITATMSTMNNSSYYQIYANASGTFSVTGEDRITKIEFTCTAEGTNKYGPGNASANVGTYSYSGATGTWTGSASSITISSTAQVRMTVLKITHTISSGSGTTTYTVTYYSNVTGIDPIEEIYNEGATVTIADNTFSNPGYAFTEWNTEADGSGDSYDPGDEIEDIDDDIDLYAQWEENTSGTTTTTYTFSSKAWAATPANWTSGKDGNSYQNGRGVQVTTGASGANATSPVSFENVSQIVVTYSTNASNGAGSIAFQVGTNTAVSQNVTTTGGTSDRTLTYDFASYQTGNVKLTVTCTTNSIYVKSVAITTAAVSTTQVATPTISPAAGAVPMPQQITITCATDDADIYYTTNGNTPDANSTHYTAPFNITGACTVKAIAIKEGLENSEIAEAEYTWAQVATPTFSLAAGTYQGTQQVTISCATEGASILYSTDGGQPNISYNGPVTISESCTLKAVAGKDGYITSAVAEAAYVIEAGYETIFSQNWEGEMNGWAFVSVTGEQVWTVTTNTGNSKYAKMSGYANSTNNTNEDWIISPAFDLNAYNNATLSFKTAKNYNGPALQVFFTNNYDDDPSEATWTALSCTLSPGSNSWAWVESGNINLNNLNLSGSSCRIGFKYTSNPTDGAATWEVDDILLIGQESTNPRITVDEESLSFTYEAGGSTAMQSLAITGSHLTEGITATISGSDKFSISADEQEWVTSLSLPAEGDVIVVRLNPNIQTTGTYNGIITFSSTGAESVTVNLTGTVTGVLYDIVLIQPTAGGTIEADKETAQQSETVTLTAHPGDAFVFGSWTVEDEDENPVTVTNNQFQMPASDVMVSATFTAKPTYAITAVANPTEGGTIFTDDEAWEGKTVEIMVEANDGYALQSLTATYAVGGETQELTITNNTFTMPAYDVTVTATFVVQLNVTYDFTDPENFFTDNTYETHPTAGNGSSHTDVTTIYYDNASHDQFTASGTTAHYFHSSGYFMLEKNSLLTLPTFDNYKITQVIFHSSSSHSKDLQVSIMSGDNTVVEAQTWSETNTDYTYNIPTGYQTSALTVKAVDKNAQFTSITLVRALDNEPYIHLVADPEEDPYLIERVWEPSGGYLREIEYGNFTPTLEANDFQISYYDETGSPITGTPEMISLLSVVNHNNKLMIEVSVTRNESAERYCYFKVGAANGNDLVYSDLVTIHQAGKPYTLTVTDLSHVNLFIFGGDESETIIDTEAGQSTAEVACGTNVEISVDVEAGYVLQSLVVDGEDVTGLIEGDLYSFTMPNHAVNITATATPFEPILYTRVTSVDDLIDDGHYIIVGFDNDDHDNAYAMGEQRSNNRAAVIISEDAPNAVVVNQNVYDFVISEVTEGQDTYYSIYDATNSGYLYAAGSGSGKNYLRTETELSANSRWAITFEDGIANVEAQGTNTNSVMQFNIGSEIFSCYFSASQKPVYLYVKANVEPTTNNSEISGTDFTATVPAGYRLIASPFNNINPMAVAGMVDGEGDYDLYYFDQEEEDEWQNYKVSPFNLKSGKGYLYANSEDVTLSFSGVPYNGNGEVALDYNANATFAGWNLIGNPYATEATLNMPFYKMNETGDGFTTKIEDLTNTIAAMEGVFVYAYDETNQQPIASATFTQVQPGNSNGDGIPQIDLKVKQNSTTIDNAIVRFDGGAMLGKFMFNPNGTRVYMSQDNKDYAIVNAMSQGEMPVNFKASKNGNYTISVNAENTEMNYMHLIDNLTGADIDLLATPSYSFEAKTTDYASRFRLVFSANDENGASTGSATFAYFNGSEWNVSNTGEATLQVIDMLGRIVSSETINGNATMSTANLGAGIYVMRLVNGENVKTQKVVVR